MGRWLVRTDDDRFLEWSSIVDAPITMLMTRAELEEYVRDEYGREGLSRLNDRIERAQKLSEIGWNRAGEGEASLSPEEIIVRYTRQSSLHQGDLHKEGK